MNSKSAGDRPTHWYVWIGVVAFLLVNTLLHLPRCLQILQEGKSLCEPSNGSLTLFVLAVAFALLVLAVVNARGLAFVRGFVRTLIVASILSMGRCTFVWADPAATAWAASRPARDHFRRASLRAAAIATWSGAMKRRAPDIPRGVELAARVRTCAFSAMEGGKRPEMSDAATWSRCTDLAADYAGFDTVSAPPRYVVPSIPAPTIEERPSTTGFTDAELMADMMRGSEPVRGDAGWRWSRARGNALSIEVSQDSLLRRPWPRIAIDTSGAMTITASEHAAPVEISPVDELQTLSTCLTGIPAEEAKRNEYSRYMWRLGTMAKKLCPQLAKRIRIDSDNSYSMTLTVARQLLGASAPVPLTNYRVTLAIVSQSPFQFTLKAEHEFFAKSYERTLTGDVR